MWIYILSFILSLTFITNSAAQSISFSSDNWDISARESRVENYFGRESDKGLVQRLTLDCAREIAKLAGRDDFQPQLAGRDWKTWQ